MRRQTPIAHLLYAHLFPRPRDDDPPSFAAHLALNLVQEVRVEVGLFYGDLVTIEAKYPGLDYCYGPHRMRLGRFLHHARLFAAFDELNLTYQEIQDFCCWEGTRWARERYEKDEGCTIEDTTGDHIPLFVDPKQRQNEPRRGSIVRKTDISIVFQDAPADLRNRRSRTSQQQAVVYIPTTSEDPTEEDEEDEEDDQEDTNMSDSACVRAENASHARDVRFVALMLLVLHCCFAFLMLSVLGPNLPHCDFFALSLASSSCSCSCGRTFFSGMNSLTVAH